MEEEVVGSTTTRRITYSLAGQAIALRVQIVGGSNTIYHLHTDHLGSTRLMSDANGDDISGSTTRYYPFGDWRTEPTANLTDRGYTGHQSNNLGTGPTDLGLIYMNARYYLPTVGKFASPDTIVPDPAGPQSHNRYSYVRNNPIGRTDPTGHVDCALLDGGGDTNGCQAPKNFLNQVHNDTTVYKLWIRPEFVDEIQLYGNTNFAFSFGTNDPPDLSPLPSYEYSQGFHGGIDLIADPGTVVYAGVYGVVEYVDGGAYRPMYVKINIGPGTSIIVGHLSGQGIEVVAGQIVTPDTPLGLVSWDQEHIHVEFWDESSSQRMILSPFEFMTDEVEQQFFSLQANMAEGDNRLTFHNRDDGLWQTEYDQPSLIYGGSNLNVGQYGYQNPWD